VGAPIIAVVTSYTASEEYWKEVMAFDAKQKKTNAVITILSSAQDRLCKELAILDLLYNSVHEDRFLKASQKDKYLGEIAVADDALRPLLEKNFTLTELTGLLKSHSISERFTDDVEKVL